jgi:phosphohistidine phosphatase
MMCYFLRHGPAGDRETWQGADSERPLTPDGRKRIAREARTIADLKLGLERIITSPLVRARETAEIVASELDLRDALIEDPRIDIGFSTERLASVLRDHRDASAIMLVGHEPSMSAVIGEAIGGGDIDLKKGAIACVEITKLSPPRGALVWLAAPKLLTR